MHPYASLANHRTEFGPNALGLVRVDTQIMERGKGLMTLLRLGPDFVLVALTILLGTFTLVCQGQQACVPFKVAPTSLRPIFLPACPSSLFPTHTRARQPPDTDVTCSSMGATYSSLALYVPPSSQPTLPSLFFVLACYLDLSGLLDQPSGMNGI